MIGPSNAEWNAQVLRDMTEKVWASRVEGLARIGGWTWYHTYRSDRSQPGWPDYVFAKDTGAVRLIFLELKTMKGRVTGPQREWLDRLDRAGREAGIARPDRLDDLARVFGHPHTPLRLHQGWDR